MPRRPEALLWRARLGRIVRKSPSLALAAGTVLGHAVTVACIPVLSRIYEPGDFGRLAVYLGVFGISVPILSLRYEAAIPVAETEGEARALFRLALGLVPVGALLAALCGTLISERQAAAGRSGLGAWFGLFVLVGLVAAGFYQVAAARALRAGAFRAIAGTKLSQSLAMTGIQVALGAAGATRIGLVIGQIAGQGAGAFRLLRASKRQWADEAAETSTVRAVARRYRDFAMISAPSSALNSAALVLPQILLAAKVGVQTAGAYFLCQRLLGTPVDLLNRSLGQVHLRSMARFRRRPKWLAVQLRATLGRLTWPAIAILALGLLGPVYTTLLLGPAWTAAGWMLAILAPANAVRAITAPIASTLLALEKNRLLFVIDAARISLLAAVFTFGPAERPVLLIGLVSAVMTLTYAIYAGAVWWVVRNWSRKDRATVP